MKKFIYLLIFSISIFAGDCSKKFDFIETADSYKIYVFDYIIDEEEELSLEAKLYLFINLSKKYHKRVYAIKLKRFTNIENYTCRDTFHSVYRVYKDDLEIIFDRNSLASNSLKYRDIRKKVLEKIAFIEVKRDLTLEDYKRLYSLYMSLGKVEDVNRIVDKMIDLKWRD